MHTYLYIKRHSVTGLKYFGQTSKSDPYTYLGSGKLWLRHIKKHGTQFVVTDWVKLFTNELELVEFALTFSKENNIVESSQWANLMQENGKHGGAKGRIVSAETRAKHSVIHGGKTISAEQREKISKTLLGRLISEETRQKISDANKGRLKDKFECPHCKQLIGCIGNAKRWHFDNCKVKPIS